MDVFVRLSVAELRALAAEVEAYALNDFTTALNH